MFQSIQNPLSQEKVASVFREAGFHRISPLESQILSELNNGKDLLVETSQREKRPSALFLPIAVLPPNSSKGLKGLILPADTEELSALEHCYKKLAPKLFRGHHIAILGKEHQARKELRLLSKHPSIIVGTPERIIDHLRRGNLDLSDLETLVFDICKEECLAGYQQDAEFILSKVSGRPRSVIFSPKPEELSFLPDLHRRSLVLSAKDRTASAPHIYLHRVDDKLCEATAKILFSRNAGGQSLVVCSSKREEEAVKQYLERSGITVTPLTAVGSEISNGCFVTSSAAKVPIPPHIGTIIYSGSAPNGTQLHQILEQTENDPDKIDIRLVSTFNNGTSSALERMEEERIMSLEEKAMPEEEEVLKGYIQNILNTIKIDEDPEELNRYRKIVRKHVPFFMRSYFAAYLLKHSGGKLSGGGRGRPRKQQRNRTEDPTKKTLFVSIGKNRKVFPRDLVHLFRSQLELEKEDIGAVKVLDNYSFVEIQAESAEAAIAKMDGMEYRGRKITVNHARKR